MHLIFGSPFSEVADFNNDTLPDLMILPASNDGVYILYNKDNALQACKPAPYIAYLKVNETSIQSIN